MSYIIYMLRIYLCTVHFACLLWRILYLQCALQTESTQQTLYQLSGLDIRSARNSSVIPLLSPHAGFHATYIHTYNTNQAPFPQFSPTYPTLHHSTHHSNNPIKHLRNIKAADAKNQQAGSDAPEPGQVPLVVLAGHPDVHAPQARDDIHGQHDGAQDRQLAQHVGRLLLPLVHPDVDLR